MKKIKSSLVLVCSRLGVTVTRTLIPVDKLYSGKVKSKIRKVSSTSNLWVCRSAGETKIVVGHGTTKEAAYNCWRKLYTDNCVQTQPLS